MVLTWAVILPVAFYQMVKQANIQNDKELGIKGQTYGFDASPVREAPKKAAAAHH